MESQEQLDKRSSDIKNITFLSGGENFKEERSEEEIRLNVKPPDKQMPTQANWASLSDTVIGMNTSKETFI